MRGKSETVNKSCISHSYYHNVHKRDKHFFQTFFARVMYTLCLQVLCTRRYSTVNTRELSRTTIPDVSLVVKSLTP